MYVSQIVRCAAFRVGTHGATEQPDRISGSFYIWHTILFFQFSHTLIMFYRSHYTSVMLITNRVT